MRPCTCGASRRPWWRRRSAPSGSTSCLVAAIVEARPDEADDIAREHARIDLELLEAARERAEAAAASESRA